MSPTGDGLQYNPYGAVVKPRPAKLTDKQKQKKLTSLSIERLQAILKHAQTTYSEQGHKLIQFWKSSSSSPSLENLKKSLIWSQEKPQVVSAQRILLEFLSGAGRTTQRSLKFQVIFAVMHATYTQDKSKKNSEKVTFLNPNQYAVDAVDFVEDIQSRLKNLICSVKLSEEQDNIPSLTHSRLVSCFEQAESWYRMQMYTQKKYYSWYVTQSQKNLRKCRTLAEGENKTPSDVLWKFFKGTGSPGLESLKFRVSASIMYDTQNNRDRSWLRHCDEMTEDAAKNLTATVFIQVKQQMEKGKLAQTCSRQQQEKLDENDLAYTL